MPMRTIIIICIVATTACRSAARQESAATDDLYQGLAPPETMTFDTGDSYREFAYARLMTTGFGPLAPLPPQLRACHGSPVDTLQFEWITLELRGDSLRGYSQDKQGYNLLAPLTLRVLSYDSTARLLSFEVATAPRTLLAFDLSPSCDSLVGVYRVQTAYHPQDEHSGVSTVEVVLHLGPHRY